MATADEECESRLIMKSSTYCFCFPFIWLFTFFLGSFTVQHSGLQGQDPPQQSMYLHLCYSDYAFYYVSFSNTHTNGTHIRAVIA